MLPRFDFFPPERAEPPVVAPKVSVVIPTWNRAPSVMHAVESVLSQTMTDFELLVVDDGSTDDTAETVDSITDPRVRLLCKSHRGRGAARNAGAAAATGELLAFLDSDDIAHPTWLEEIVAAMEANHCDLVLSGHQSLEPDGRLTEHLPSARGWPDADYVSPVFLAGCWILKRQLFLQCGGYDPDIRVGENSEVALRLFSLNPNLRVAVLPRALIRVTERAEQADRFEQVKGAQTVLTRYRPFHRRFPKVWASYNTVVGVDWAFRGEFRRARQNLAQAFVADPFSPRRLLRLAAASLPFLARRIWSSTKSPGVLFIVLAPGIGGSVRSLAAVLKGMPELRRVVAGPPNSSTERFLSERGLVDAYIPLSGPSRWRVYDRLRSTGQLALAALADRSRLAAIHANGLAELNLALLPALVSRRPIVVWVHEWTVPRWTRRLAPVFRLARRRIRFAAVSQQSAEMIAAARLAVLEQISVVTNPVDPDDICGRHEGSANDLLRVTYLGTPAVYKGFHLLPALVRATNDPGIRWTVYSGPETMMPDTFAELREMGVELAGKVTDVRIAYSSCDVVVVPSLKESFGRVVAEAMANSLPVVASDLRVIRELVGDDEAGLLVPPGDIPGFAAAIRRLAGDAALRNRLGEAGLARSARFLPDPVLSALRHLYGTTALNDGQIATRRARP